MRWPGPMVIWFLGSLLKMARIAMLPSSKPTMRSKNPSFSTGYFFLIIRSCKWCMFHCLIFTSQPLFFKSSDTPPKFNSSPLKSYRNPIGKDRLPTIIFQGRGYFFSNPRGSRSVPNWRVPCVLECHWAFNLAPLQLMDIGVCNVEHG